MTDPGRPGRSDGGDYRLWIGVFDAYGNLSAEPPRAEARCGSVGEPVPVESGWWMVPYRPPRDARHTEDVLQVAAGPASGSASLRPANSDPANASSDRSSFLTWAIMPTVDHAGRSLARK